MLVLTTFRDEGCCPKHCGRGLRDSLLKESSAEELIRAVRLVAVGESVLDPAITASVLDTYRNAGSPSKADAAALGRLTARERTVLELISRGLTNDGSPQSW